jgi:2-methylcitrate dehydratase PrpD
VEALKQLKAQHPFPYTAVREIVIHTFTESARLQHTPPKNTEEAQYHLFFPAACYLVYGEVGPEQVLHRLNDPEILRMMEKCSVTVEEELNAVFPGKALSWVEIRLEDGRVLKSRTCQAAGDFDYPLSEEELRAKYFRLTEPLLGKERSSRLLDLIERLEELDHIRSLARLLTLA